MQGCPELLAAAALPPPRSAAAGACCPPQETRHAAWGKGYNCSWQKQCWEEQCIKWRESDWSHAKEDQGCKAQMHRAQLGV